MTDKSRLPLPDLLKGFAVLFMIQVHIMELLATEDIFESVAGKISLFIGGVPAAPVFMIMMGYFVGLKNYSGWAMIRRGARLFLAGLLLNLLLNTNLAYHTFCRGWEEFINIYHFWLGADILHLAGLSLITISVFSVALKQKWWAWALLAVAISALPGFISPYEGDHTLLRYVYAFIYSQEEWSYFPLIPWLAYPVAGYAFRLIENRYSGIIADRKTLTISGGILLIISGVTAPFGTKIVTQLPEYYHHGVRFFAWAISLSALWTIVLKLITEKTTDNMAIRYIRWLGENVTLIYIIQWLIIGNLATSLYRTQSLIHSLLWFLAVLAVTSVLTQLYRSKLGSFRI